MIYLVQDAYLDDKKFGLEILEHFGFLLSNPPNGSKRRLHL